MFFLKIHYSTLFVNKGLQEKLTNKHIYLFEISIFFYFCVK